ncbi:MAG: GspE/PulE family protein, partial [Bacillota bacterium]
MLNHNSKKLGEILLELKHINQKQLDNTIRKRKESQKRIGEIMLELEYINEEELIEALETQLGISRVNLDNFNMKIELIQYIPENMARYYNVLPLEIVNERLKVAMTDPFDLIAIEDIELASGLKVDPYIASEKEIKKNINRFYALDTLDTNQVFNSLSEKQAEAENKEKEEMNLKKMIDDAPIVRLTNIIIGQAIQMKASDIHIEPGPKNVRIRYRIDGVLRENMTVPKHSQAPLISRFKIIANLDITKRMIPQDGRVHLNFKGEEIDMRVSSLPTIHGEKIVIRLLSRDNKLLELDNLGLSENNYEHMMELITKPHGIILTTGPTGSGKTTTLFASLDYLNSEGENIITVEDPVEYQLEGINQVQAHKKAGLTFAGTLRSILRQDPDIIMIGEIRDEETSQIAVRAALTGHLVLSTLHTNDAISAITRLIDMGIPSYLVASTVEGIIAQRLVRRLCPECKESYLPGNIEKEYLNLKPGEEIYKPGKCNHCNDIGYRGRLAIYEIFMM